MDNKGKTGYSGIDLVSDCDDGGGSVRVHAMLEDGELSGNDFGRVAVWQIAPQSISESLPSSPDHGQRSPLPPSGSSAAPSWSSSNPGPKNHACGLSYGSRSLTQPKRSEPPHVQLEPNWMLTASKALSQWHGGALNRHELAASIDALQMPRASSPNIPVALAIVLALLACIFWFGSATPERMGAVEVARTEAVAW